MPASPHAQVFFMKVSTVVVKAASRGPCYQVEVVANILGGHFSKAKRNSRSSSRVMEWTMIRGLSRKGGAVCPKLREALDFGLCFAPLPWHLPLGHDSISLISALNDLLTSRESF